MIEGAWSRFLDYAAHAATKPAFDVEERQWKLAVAVRLREAIAAARKGEDWLPTVLTALARTHPPFIAAPAHRHWLRAWSGRDPAAARDAVASFATPGDPIATFSRFAEAVERSGPEQAPAGTAIALGSVFNFATSPEALPIVRPHIFDQLEALVGLRPAMAERSAIVLYDDALKLAREVCARLTQHGV